MDDSTVIGEVLNGDKDAFRVLVERYQSQAVGHSMAILSNREDALDATQEAFVDAFRALEKFDLSRRFYPWFYVLLRHRCFKIIAHKREGEPLDDREILASKNGIADDERIALEEALHRLSREGREVITLKYLDGFSYDEIAELLEIPRGTVMSRLFTARKLLQSKLTEEFH